MGQKVRPYVLRLGLNQSWQSNYFPVKKNQAYLLQQDKLIEQYIKCFTVYRNKKSFHLYLILIQKYNRQRQDWLRKMCFCCACIYSQRTLHTFFSIAHTFEQIYFHIHFHIITALNRKHLLWLSEFGGTRRIGGIFYVSKLQT